MSFVGGEIGRVGSAATGAARRGSRLTHRREIGAGEDQQPLAGLVVEEGVDGDARRLVVNHGVGLLGLALERRDDARLEPGAQDLGGVHLDLLGGVPIIVRHVDRSAPPRASRSRPIARLGVERKFLNWDDPSGQTSTNASPAPGDRGGSAHARGFTRYKRVLSSSRACSSSTDALCVAPRVPPTHGRAKYRASHAGVRPHHSSWPFGRLPAGLDPHSRRGTTRPPSNLQPETVCPYEKFTRTVAVAPRPPGDVAECPTPRGTSRGDETRAGHAPSPSSRRPSRGLAREARTGAPIGSEERRSHGGQRDARHAGATAGRQGGPRLPGLLRAPAHPAQRVQEGQLLPPVAVRARAPRLREVPVQGVRARGPPPRPLAIPRNRPPYARQSPPAHPVPHPSLTPPNPAISPGT